ncbi:hypothetical protein F5141DRAFT_1212028 [Pisolithus sp. B1]|nr:hypothetical protein F5141DRAFT_1212028 [Pisolithus sp. B1]
MFIVEQVLTEFPFWEECDQLWHGNLSYDARVFNASPGAHWTGDFLTLIKSGGATAPPACDDFQAQDQSDAVDYPGSSANANWDPNTNNLMDAVEQEEEEGKKDEGWEGDWNIVSALEYHTDFMSTDEQPQAFLCELGNSTGMVLPLDKPPTPYPRPSASTISTTTMSSTPSNSTQHASINSETSQTSFMKGKNVLAQIKSDHNEQLTGLSETSQDQCLLRATLKYEYKVVKMQAYIEDPFPTMLEEKKLDLQMLKEESELVHLKLELAKFQSLQAGNASGLSVSTATPGTTHPDSL